MREDWTSSHRSPGPFPDPDPFDNYFMRAPSSRRHLKSTLDSKEFFDIHQPFEAFLAQSEARRAVTVGRETKHPRTWNAKGKIWNRKSVLPADSPTSLHTKKAPMKFVQDLDVVVLDSNEILGRVRVPLTSNLKGLRSVVRHSFKGLTKEFQFAHADGVLIHRSQEKKLGVREHCRSGAAFILDAARAIKSDVQKESPELPVKDTADFDTRSRPSSSTRISARVSESPSESEEEAHDHLAPVVFCSFEQSIEQEIEIVKHEVELFAQKNASAIAAAFRGWKARRLFLYSRQHISRVQSVVRIWMRLKKSRASDAASKIQSRVRGFLVLARLSCPGRVSVEDISRDELGGGRCEEMPSRSASISPKRLAESPSHSTEVLQPAAAPILVVDSDPKERVSETRRFADSQPSPSKSPRQAESPSHSTEVLQPAAAPLLIEDSDPKEKVSETRLFADSQPSPSKSPRLNVDANLQEETTRNRRSVVESPPPATSFKLSDETESRCHTDDALQIPSPSPSSDGDDKEGLPGRRFVVDDEMPSSWVSSEMVEASSHSTAVLQPTVLSRSTQRDDPTEGSSAQVRRFVHSHSFPEASVCRESVSESSCRSTPTLQRKTVPLVTNDDEHLEEEAEVRGYQEVLLSPSFSSEMVVESSFETAKELPLPVVFNLAVSDDQQRHVREESSRAQRFFDADPSPSQPLKVLVESSCEPISVLETPALAAIHGEDVRRERPLQHQSFIDEPQLPPGVPLGASPEIVVESLATPNEELPRAGVVSSMGLEDDQREGASHSQSFLHESPLSFPLPDSAAESSPLPTKVIPQTSTSPMSGAGALREGESRRCRMGLPGVLSPPTASAKVALESSCSHSRRALQPTTAPPFPVELEQPEAALQFHRCVDESRTTPACGEAVGLLSPMASKPSLPPASVSDIADSLMEHRTKPSAAFVSSGSWCGGSAQSPRSSGLEDSSSSLSSRLPDDDECSLSLTSPPLSLLPLRVVERNISPLVPSQGTTENEERRTSLALELDDHACLSSNPVLTTGIELDGRFFSVRVECFAGASAVNIRAKDVARADSFSTIVPFGAWSCACKVVDGEKKKNAARAVVSWLRLTKDGKVLFVDAPAEHRLATTAPFATEEVTSTKQQQLASQAASSLLLSKGVRVSGKYLLARVERRTEGFVSVHAREASGMRTHSTSVDNSLWAEACCGRPEDAKCALDAAHKVLTWLALSDNRGLHVDPARVQRWPASLSTEASRHATTSKKRAEELPCQDSTPSANLGPNGERLLYHGGATISGGRRVLSVFRDSSSLLLLRVWTPTDSSRGRATISPSLEARLLDAGKRGTEAEEGEGEGEGGRQAAGADEFVHLWRGLCECARVGEDGSLRFSDASEPTFIVGFERALSPPPPSGLESRTEELPLFQREGAIGAEEPLLSLSVVVGGKKLLVAASVDLSTGSIRLGAFDAGSKAQLETVVEQREWQRHVLPCLPDLPFGSSDTEHLRQVARELVRSLVVGPDGTFAVSLPETSAGASGGGSVDSAVSLPLYTGSVDVGSCELVATVHDDKATECLVFEVFSESNSTTQVCTVSHASCENQEARWEERSFAQKRAFAKQMCGRLRVGEGGHVTLPSPRRHEEGARVAALSVLQPLVRPPSRPLVSCGLTRTSDEKLLLVSAHDDESHEGNSGGGGLLICALDPSSMSHFQARVEVAGWSALDREEKAKEALARCNQMLVAPSLSARSLSDGGKSIESQSTASGDELQSARTPRPHQALAETAPVAVFGAIVSDTPLLCRFYLCGDHPQQSIVLKACEAEGTVEYEAQIEASVVEAAFSVANVGSLPADERNLILRRLSASSSLTSNNLTFDLNRVRDQTI